MFRLDWKGKRAIAGYVLAGLVLLMGCIWWGWKKSLVLAVVIAGMGVAVLQKCPKWLRLGLYACWGLGMLGFLCLYNPLTGIFKGTMGMLVLNYLCVLAVVAVVYAISGSWRVSISVSVVLLALLSTANLFIYQFRSKEFAAMDFLSIGTAANVVGQYKFQMSKRLAEYLLLLTAGFFAQFFLAPFPKLSRRGKWIGRGAAVAVLAVLCVVIGCATRDIRVITWGHKGSRVNGYYLNFYLGLRDAKVKQPEGYSPEAVGQMGAGVAEVQPEKKPNIIIIMDEAFSDLRVFGGKLNTNEPVMPFIDSLRENTVKGYALCSVLGGNTANSEFEMLTGHSMAFLPTGAVPYQQYLFQDSYSLGWLLGNLGYTSLVTHPYLASGWSRTSVYPRLGFQEMTFEEAYPHEDLVREYVSDREMFRYLLDRLENKGDDPALIFGITMQNHGGYEYVGDNFEKSISLEGYYRDYPRAEQYLSLIHETDQAVEELIGALEDYEEDTIVLFFGDHMPSIEQGLYNKLSGNTLETLEGQMDQYTVPFFIWANYDIPEETVELTSLNYLSNLLLEYAGVGLHGYHAALEEIRAVIPAVNANGYYSVSQGKFLPLEDAQGAEKEALERYACLQYNDLFDGKHRDERLFGRFMKA